MFLSAPCNQKFSQLQALDDAAFFAASSMVEDVLSIST